MESALSSFAFISEIEALISWFFEPFIGNLRSSIGSTVFKDGFSVVYLVD